MKRRKMLSVLAALGVLPLMGAEGCSSGGSRPDVGPKKSVTISFFLEKEYSPYTATIWAKDLKTGEVLVDLHEPVGGGVFDRVLLYDSGHRVEIRCELKPGKIGSKSGYVKVTDGPANVKSARIDGSWRATLEMHTVR